MKVTPQIQPKTVWNKRTLEEKSMFPPSILWMDSKKSAGICISPNNSPLTINALCESTTLL
jgi:hypothetical protein